MNKELPVDRLLKIPHAFTVLREAEVINDSNQTTVSIDKINALDTLDIFKLHAAVTRVSGWYHYTFDEKIDGSLHANPTEKAQTINRIDTHVAAILSELSKQLFKDNIILMSPRLTTTKQREAAAVSSTFNTYYSVVTDTARLESVNATDLIQSMVSNSQYSNYEEIEKTFDVGIVSIVRDLLRAKITEIRKSATALRDVAFYDTINNKILTTIESFKIDETYIKDLMLSDKFFTTQIPYGEIRIINPSGNESLYVIPYDIQLVQNEYLLNIDVDPAASTFITRQKYDELRSGSKVEHAGTAYTNVPASLSKLNNALKMTRKDVFELLLKSNNIDFNQLLKSAAEAYSEYIKTMYAQYSLVAATPQNAYISNTKKATSMQFNELRKMFVPAIAVTLRHASKEYLLYAQTVGYADKNASIEDFVLYEDKNGRKFFYTEPPVTYRVSFELSFDFNVLHVFEYDRVTDSHKLKSLNIKLIRVSVGDVNIDNVARAGYTTWNTTLNEKVNFRIRIGVMLDLPIHVKYGIYYPANLFNEHIKSIILPTRSSKAYAPLNTMYSTYVNLYKKFLFDAYVYREQIIKELLESKQKPEKNNTLKVNQTSSAGEDRVSVFRDFIMYARKLSLSAVGTRI